MPDTFFVWVSGNTRSMKNLINDLMSEDNQKASLASDMLCSLSNSKDIADLLETLSIYREMSVLTPVAIGVGHLKLHQAVPLLVQKILDPEYKKKRGVFVSALSGLNWTDYCDILANLIVEGGYEIMELALQALERNEYAVKKELKAKAILILSNALNNKSDVEKKRYIESAIEIVSSYQERE